MEEGWRGEGISTHQRQDVEAELGDYLLRHWPKTRWTAGEVEEPGEALCGALRTFVNESSSRVRTPDRGFTYYGAAAELPHRRRQALAARPQQPLEQSHQFQKIERHFD